jgi:Zn-finger nucleic acid-binding protein
MLSLDLGMNDGAYYIERCSRCLGVFFDNGELEPVLNYYATNMSLTGHGNLQHMYDTHVCEDAAGMEVRCPVCRINMSVEKDETRGGLPLRTCPQHGTWMSGLALQQLLHWVDDEDRLEGGHHRGD